MSWPLSQDYNEAIQDPRQGFSDTELREGEAVANALGIPMPRSGNFADVYEVRCPSGARWAVKCFTREVHGLRERYAEISNYLRQASLPFTVDFQYLEQGIRVCGQWFPILKMKWVEGFVLNEFVRDNLDKKPILHALGQIWLRMARRLCEAKLAHGDLQHGNVMFVPGSSANSLAVKLIDYDGMCVPSLAGKNSGELGHPAYQHPERLRAGVYNQQVDRFSLLSIAAALRCLTVGGRSLWERYDNGDNLLFRQEDLQAPAESSLFRELLAIGDPQSQLLVKELYRACQGPLTGVPLLIDLMPEEKPASKATTASYRAAAQESEWDFGDEEPGAIVRKRRASTRGSLLLWGALGGAAALLLCIGLAVGLFPHRAATNKEGTPVARNKADRDTPNPTTKPQSSKSEPQQPNSEPQPPANSDAPLPSLKPITPPPEAAAQPTAIAGQAVVWNPPIDPDGDCKFQNAGGKLTITVPGKYHDLGAERGRMNAPRVVFDVEGDFAAQVRVSGDFIPSTDATAAGKIPVAGAGLALLVDDKTYVRLERFGVYRRPQFEAYVSWELRQNGRRTFSRTSPRLSEKTTYLRMGRRGDTMFGSLSEDGLKWIELQAIPISLPRKVKLGVDVVTTSSRPFATIFDQFRLKKGQGEMAAVDWPSLPPVGTVVVKPPQPAEGADAWSHLDLPRDLKPDSNDSILRIPRGRTVATRQEYSGPLDITMIVRGPQDQDVSFIAPGGAMVTFRYRRTTQQSHVLNVRRPDQPRGELGTLISPSRPIVLPENKWCTLHWEITATGMKVSINKQPLCQELVRYDLTAKYPVKIRVNRAMVEVKSMVVKPLKKQRGSVP